ncbi:Hemoglobin subunit alpha-D [Cuculus canorus]|uniref:Hemoglobin subunit alpha-D n=1 Tax=Cuculus canorus TaxID=55661 RepID=A0A091GLF5_CUCCA|nr:Hemoglobin subunit alpha-D [Cuculus canorus]
MLTAEEQSLIQKVWEKTASHRDEIGGESLYRLFTSYPSTKTYFPHFDLSCGSEQIRSHGKKVVAALSTAVKSLDNLSQALSELSSLHAYNLRVDPELGPGTGNRSSDVEPHSALQLLSQCIQVVLALHLGKEYTPEVHAAFDKFLSAVAAVLSEKYR